MKLPRSHVYVDESGCTGVQGYSTIRAGAVVLLLDEAGAVLATDDLGAGVASETDCVFDFVLENVPLAGSYQVRVGDWAGAPNSYEDMTRQGWTVDLYIR